LDVAGERSPAYDKVIAARVEFRSQHFNVRDTALPKSPQKVADKKMLKNDLPQH
jgi:hypothetical protein